MIPYQTILKFCSSAAHRASLLLPWHDEEGRLSASDGRVLIRVDAAEVEGAPEALELMRARHWWPPGTDEAWALWEDVIGDWSPLDVSMEVGEEWCARCEGDGWWRCNCPTCSSDHECWVCGGLGERRVYHPDKVEFAGTRYEAGLIALAQRLPNVEWRAGAHHLALRFGRSGMGVMLGLRPAGSPVPSGVRGE